MQNKRLENVLIAINHVHVAIGGVQFSIMMGTMHMSFSVRVLVIFAYMFVSFCLRY